MNKLKEQTVWFVLAVSPQPEMHILTLFVADGNYVLSVRADTSRCHAFVSVWIE